MKKILYKIYWLITLLLVTLIANAQLPLQYGDAVITHSPNTFTSSGLSTTPAVLRVVHTSNTSTAPLGATWDVSSPGNKPPNDFYSNWNVATLGYVFGITLDENINPNIYVSSTQIYTNTTLNQRKVWRINGATGANGANSLVFDFNNISGFGNNTSARSLGNLKYLKVGVTENIYVSDWDKGEIKRLTGNSTSTALWANQNAFLPKFGKPTHDVNEMPYGLAIRRLLNGSYRLYYSKISTANINNNIGSYGNNEIWSVDLNAVGDFILGTEIQANIPNINRAASSWGGYSGQPASSIPYGSTGCTVLPVISDIAFTNDGNKMLVGQQSWRNFGVLAPHNSAVFEFKNISNITWINSGSWFPSGQWLVNNCYQVNAQANAVGGVSYSNNILRQDSLSFGCDTTVWFTSDYINISNGNPGNTVYGLQGMNSTGSTLSSSIWIDADDNLQFYDKVFLGDVEVYKKPNVCTGSSCLCGKFDYINFNNNIWWQNNAIPSPPLPSLTFNPGQATGIIFPYYNCTGIGCTATFTYSLISNGVATPIAGGPNGLDLGQSQITALPCGNYFLQIAPHCGNSYNCEPITIPLVIICPPVCSCSGTVTINQSAVNVVSQNNTVNANPVSTVSTSFTLTSSTPVAEVRMLVDEFRLTTATGNENCTLCKNKPQTWANINSASLSGLTNQTLANPSTLQKDIRELIFNNGGPAFNLAGNTLNLTLGIPGVTGLNCCTLKGEVCIKFIIRDVNCCEREVMKCFTFNLQ